MKESESGVVNVMVVKHMIVATADIAWTNLKRYSEAVLLIKTL